MIRRRPGSTLFTYTTLFRSGLGGGGLGGGQGGGLLTVPRVAVATSGQQGGGTGVGGQTIGLTGITRTNNMALVQAMVRQLDRKSTRLNSSHLGISYAVFCLK